MPLIQQNRIILFICSCLVALTLNADPLSEHYKVSNFKNIYGQAPIADMVNIPQDSSALQAPFSNKGIDSFKNYYAQYFKVWSENPNIDLSEIEQIFTKHKTYYLENYSPVTDEIYKNLEENADLKATGSLNQKAIVVHPTALRCLPTKSIFFDNPNEAGEGYPFDYLQEDSLHLGEPLLISHFSRDGKFAFVLSTSGSPGFVDVQDIAAVSDEFIHKFQQKLVMLSKDTLGYAVGDKKHAFPYELQITTVLPLQASGVVLIPIKNARAQAELIPVQLVESKYTAHPLKFSEQNVKQLVDQLVNQPYGWGSTLQHMDCARLVRNYFALFGTHLPLLSKQQKLIGSVVNIEDLTPEQKRAKIIADAIPYQSFIYMPGHIALYLGTYNAEPIILHATWGIKLYDANNEAYRYVLGKSVITTLIPGKELVGFDMQQSSLLPKLYSFSNFNPN